MGGALGAVVGVAGGASTRGATARVGAAARRTIALHGERGGALLGHAVRLGLLGQDDSGKNGVEAESLVAENHVNGVETLGQAMKELRGKIHLGDGMVDVGEAVGKELHATCVLRDREVTLLEVAVLAVEHHEAGDATGEEEVLDLVPDGKGSGGADDVIAHGVRKGGIDP